MRRRLSAPSTLAMSFLDTVCSGFGAAIFLFLVLLTQPSTKAVQSAGSTEYLVVEVRWEQPDAVVELWVTPPSRTGEEGLFAGNWQVEPATGQLLRGRAASWHGAWSQAFFVGPSVRGLHMPSSQQAQAVVSTLWIVAPCPGEWVFRPTLVNRPGGDTWISDKSTPASTITIEVRGAVHGEATTAQATLRIDEAFRPPSEQVARTKSQSTTRHHVEAKRSLPQNCIGT